MHAPMRDAIEPAINELDVSRLGRALVSKKWWVLGPTLAAFVAAFLFVNVVKPRYTSDARLLLENQDDFFTRVDKGERVGGNEPDAEGMQSQIQLLTSRDLSSVSRAFSRSNSRTRRRNIRKRWRANA